MSTIRKMLRTVRVTEAVKYVKKAVKSTSFQIGSNMRLRIHYDSVAETCGIVVDEDGSKDEAGNKKLFIPCRSVAGMGAAWSHHAKEYFVICDEISKMERSVNRLYTNLASEKERFPSLHEYEKFKRH